MKKIQEKPEALAVLARSICPRGPTQPLGLKGPPALLLFGSFTFLPLAGAFPVSFFGADHCSPGDGGVAKGEKWILGWFCGLRRKTAVLDILFFWITWLLLLQRRRCLFKRVRR